MSQNFEELAFHQTPLGDLILRRRRMLSLGGVEIYEVKLGDGFLMSSLFHDVEEALARLGLAALQPGKWDVVVGGLGLGYTARAALEHANVASLLVIDTLQPVIDWHTQGLVPLGAELTADSRTRFLCADFFARAQSEAGFDPGQAGRRYHAVLLDIDHSPQNLLHLRNMAFYRAEGLQKMAQHLHPGGVFALWSDDPPDDAFMAALRTSFSDPTAHVVTFDNPVLECESASTVYVAIKP